MMFLFETWFYYVYRRVSSLKKMKQGRNVARQFVGSGDPVYQYIG